MQENKPNQQEIKPNEHSIDNTIKDLLKIIPAQYSQLDLLSNNLKGIHKDAVERIQVQEDFRQAGLAFRGSIVFAFEILENNHTPQDEKTIEEYKKRIGTEPFKDLADAIDFSHTTTRLLKNLLEYVDDINEELSAQEILDKI